MADDPFAVKLISATHVVEVDNALQMHRVYRVRIQIGNYGQFVKDFPDGQDNTEAINAWKLQKKLELQAIA